MSDKKSNIICGQVIIPLYINLLLCIYMMLVNLLFVRSMNIDEGLRFKVKAMLYSQNIFNNFPESAFFADMKNQERALNFYSKAKNKLQKLEKIYSEKISKTDSQNQASRYALLSDYIQDYIKILENMSKDEKERPTNPELIQEEITYFQNIVSAVKKAFGLHSNVKTGSNQNYSLNLSSLFDTTHNPSLFNKILAFLNYRVSFYSGINDFLSKASQLSEQNRRSIFSNSIPDVKSVPVQSGSWGLYFVEKIPKGVNKNLKNLCKYKLEMRCQMKGASQKPITIMDLKLDEINIGEDIFKILRKFKNAKLENLKDGFRIGSDFDPCFQNIHLELFKAYHLDKK